MEDCIFCKIANGEIGKLIYENDFVAAFDDLNPQATVHSLVIPKKHIKNIEDLNFCGHNVDNKEEKNEKCEKREVCDGQYIKEIFKAIKEVAKIKGISDSGYRVISNCGESAGQSVMHLHFHILGGQKLGEKII